MFQVPRDLLSCRLWSAIHCLGPVLAACLFSWVPATAATNSAGLTGHWKATMEMGKFQMRMGLVITRSPEGKVTGMIKMRDQGPGDVPLGAVLFNPPDVRLEIDMFNTNYRGRLSEDGRFIRGELEEGPGGRAMPLTFERDEEADRPPPVKSYTTPAGASPDLRGYWSSMVSLAPKETVRVGLKIAHLDDGRFEVLLDRFEHGIKEAQATLVSVAEGETKLGWQFLEATFTGKLNPDASSLTGTWSERGRKIEVTFARRARPITALPDDISLVADPKARDDVRGEWNGILETGGPRIRIVFKMGRLPDGSFAATLSSPDQGGVEMPAGTVEWNPPALKAEWKGIRGTLSAKLSSDGSELEGTWEQGGRPLDLKMRRPVVAEAQAKP